ncbi:MAG: D-alanine--poly(phosphoribitol) ligase subunit DltA [Coriobacteriia bacterium]|nr:D-alanine--poly(phosphoribitol) ligase subunit DltA [Coriobacteriia bacterium]
MGFLAEVGLRVAEQPDRIAVVGEDRSMTYRELWNASDALAVHLQKEFRADRTPVVVYGHKSAYMPVCFLGALKSGRAYVPMDYSIPSDRVSEIVRQTKAKTVFCMGKRMTCIASDLSVVSEADVAGLAALWSSQPLPDSHWACGDDPFYVLFTSGSTGAPKGVEITCNCVDNFLSWAITLGGVDKLGRTFINQAPFSFDLSVFELTMSLASGGTLFCLVKESQSNMNVLFETLARSGAHVWVSTPSFAEMCLSDKGFSSKLMPAVDLFLFCGETLSNSTARKLHERFPGASVVNTYGPTESTVAVTAVEITKELAHCTEALPVGSPKPGTRIEIIGADGEELPIGQPGEICIVGDTVSTGYFGRPDLTEAAFGVDTATGMRTYRTGDMGWLDEAGSLHFLGRMDFQVKLNGYRIELGDIESNLLALCYVDSAVVLPVSKDGRVSYLTACIVANELAAGSRLQKVARVKEDLKSLLPEYMIPRKIAFFDKLPMTDNGKIDRKRLIGELA